MRADARPKGLFLNAATHSAQSVRPGLERHRRGRDHGRAEAAVAPGLRRVADLEAEQRRHLVVVEAARRADVDEQAVDLAALEAAVLERGLRRRGPPSRRRDSSAMLPKPTVPMPTTATPPRHSVQRRRAAASLSAPSARRRPADRRRRALELEREAGGADAVDAGVDDHLARERLLLLDDLGDVVDEARRDAQPRGSARRTARAPSRAAKSGASSASSSSRCATRAGLVGEARVLDEPGAPERSRRASSNIASVPTPT